MKCMDIFFEDLNKLAQDEYIEFIGAKIPDEINMGAPLATIEFEDSEEDN